jgi:hypothetical protein
MVFVVHTKKKGIARFPLKAEGDETEDGGHGVGGLFGKDSNPPPLFPS